MKRFNMYIKEHFYLQVLLRMLGVLVVIGIFIAICRFHQYKNIPDVVDGTKTLCQYVVVFMLNNSLFIEVLGGLIGVFAAFWLLRAHFHITPVLALTNTNQLKVQICSDMAFIPLTDIKVELDFVRDLEGGKTRRTKRIHINKNEISIIGGRFAGSAKSFYTVHTNPGFIWNGTYEMIRCRVSATNGITGVARIEEYFIGKNETLYGIFDDEKFVKQDKYYAEANNELWGSEKKTRIIYLQYILNDLLRAVEINAEITNEQMLLRVSRAKWQAERLCGKQMQTIFPVLKEEYMIIESINQRLNVLSLIYECKKITPLNEYWRDQNAEECKKYIIYLIKQMDDK